MVYSSLRHLLRHTKLVYATPTCSIWCRLRCVDYRTTVCCWQLIWVPRHHAMLAVCCVEYYCFASAAVAVDSSHMTASSSALWSRFCPPSYFVSGHVSTVWFMVCRWPQSQKGDWARPHLCKLADMGLDLSSNGSSETMYNEGDQNLAVGS